MKISYVAVTNRPAFRDALWEQYKAQRWADKELVVVDSSEDGGILRDEADRYIHEKPDGKNVGELRNRGMAAATGDAIMWFDDDDWRHPDLSNILAERMIETDAPLVGLNASFWIDLEGSMNQRWRGWPIFAASLYALRRPMPLFRSKPPRKTDSYWMLRIFKHYDEKADLVFRAPLYVIVTHGANVHNPELLERPGRWTENDTRFLPGDPEGLAAHMDRLRRAVA